MYEIRFLQDNGRDTILHIESSGNTEAIIRGLIHEGIEITIREVYPYAHVVDNEQVIKYVTKKELNELQNSHHYNRASQAAIGQRRPDNLMSAEEVMQTNPVARG